MGRARTIFVGPYPPPYAGPEIAMKTLLDSPLAEIYDISFIKTNVRNSNADKGKYDFTIVEFDQVSDQIIIWYLIIGVFIGVLGSVVSIRKYLKV